MGEAFWGQAVSFTLSSQNRDREGEGGSKLTGAPSCRDTNPTERAPPRRPHRTDPDGLAKTPSAHATPRGGGGASACESGACCDPRQVLGLSAAGCQFGLLISVFRCWVGCAGCLSLLTRKCPSDPVTVPCGSHWPQSWPQTTALAGRRRYLLVPDSPAETRAGWTSLKAPTHHEGSGPLYLLHHRLRKRNPCRGSLAFLMKKDFPFECDGATWRSEFGMEVGLLNCRGRALGWVREVACASSLTPHSAVLALPPPGG